MGQPYNITSNLGSAIVTTGGTDAPASGTVETFVVSNTQDIPVISASVTQFAFVDAAIATNPNLAEVFTCTNISGASWTVIRGAEVIGANAASPVAHSANWTAKIVATAGTISNSTPIPLNVSVSATNASNGIFNITTNATADSSFTSAPILSVTNENDAEGAFSISYYYYDRATRLIFGSGNSAGFVLEYAPPEDIFIFGAVDGAGLSYPVSTYIDSQNVFHFAYSIQPNAPFVYVAAPTSGYFEWQMPFVGGYKQLVLMFNAYENDTGSNQVINTSTGGYSGNYQAPFTTLSGNPGLLVNTTGLTIACVASGSGNQITITTTDSVTTYTGICIFGGI